MSTGGVAIAYSAPSSRATGFVVTAAVWNQDVVDNIIAIAAHAHTGAAGDGAGTLTVADGSNSAPSYSNTGDTNTGMYFPAADSVGFSTGGTLRLTLDTTTTGDAWTAYVPTWGGGVTAIGNATVTARYWKVGRKVWFFVSATFGTTTTFAAATFTISLPVTAIGTIVGPIGTAYLVDTGTTQNTGVVMMASTTAVTIRVTVAGAALVSNTVPHTWANTDVLQISGCYEAAS